jgi:hypothetical protein
VLGTIVVSATKLPAQALCHAGEKEGAISPSEASEGNIQSRIGGQYCLLLVLRILLQEVL